MQQHVATRVTAFDDIRPGMALPVMRLNIERRDLVRYAGASDDYVRLHWDLDFTQQQGFPDVIVHGWLTCAHMLRAVSDWVTPDVAAIASYRIRYHSPLYPGLLSCGGEVGDITDGMATLDLWARDAADGQVASASLALVRPPVESDRCTNWQSEAKGGK